MKANTFLNAVGLIDEQYLDISIPRIQIKRRKRNKILVTAAAAAALVVCPLPAMTACGVDSAYHILYHIAPAAAQTFKPVQRSCEDNGVEMTVISAERSGSEFNAYIAMHDTTGTCPYGDWDLYDSYHINVRRDMNGTCSFSEYDADTHTAYFVVHLETMDGSEMPKGKVTFSVREMLRGKIRTEGPVEGIDMSSIPYEPPTESYIDICGGYSNAIESDVQDCRFLIPAEQPICSPAPQIDIMGIGYVDGALHILSRHKDNRHTDSHGFVHLLDNAGSIIAEQEEHGYYYWDAAHKDHLVEQVIPVSYELLPECSLSGEFVTAQDYVSGNWEITFPLN